MITTVWLNIINDNDKLVEDKLLTTDVDDNLLTTS